MRVKSKEMKSEALSALEQAINSMIDEFDANFMDYAEGYADCIESDDIIRSFLENYNTRSMDELSADEVRAMINDDDKLVQMIWDCSEIQACGYYAQGNEMGSVAIGEMDYELDLDQGEIKELISQLSAEELELNPEFKESQMTVYGNPCDRLILKLDPELFLEALAKLKKPKRSQKSKIKATVLPMTRYEYRRGVIKARNKKRNGNFDPRLFSADGRNIIQFKVRG